MLLFKHFIEPDIFSLLLWIKLIKGASPTKMRIRKRRFANFHKDGNLNVGSNQQKGNSFEQSFLIVESEAPEQEFSGSDWEIV